MNELRSTIAAALEGREEPLRVAAATSDADMLAVLRSVIDALGAPLEVLRVTSQTAVGAAGPIVVRVAMPGRSSVDAGLLVRAARSLHAAGVPTANPRGGLTVGNWEVTLWERCADDGRPRWAALGRSIRDFHTASAVALPTLPPFSATLEDLRAVVLRTEVKGHDAARIWERESTRIATAPQVPVLHGDVNLGNVLWSDRPLLVDLERCSSGPPEWDFARLMLEVPLRHSAASMDDIIRGYEMVLEEELLTACTRLIAVYALGWRLHEAEVSEVLEDERIAIEDFRRRTIQLLAAAESAEKAASHTAGSCGNTAAVGGASA